MDTEIRRILDDIDDRATRLLQHNKARLNALARRLLEHETLGREEIEMALQDVA